MNIYWKAALIACAIVAYLMASALDRADAEREQQVYCDNVEAGYWPDYNGNAAEVCNETQD